MKPVLALFSFALLAACHTMPGVVSCDNAAKVRAAAALALHALDRACPIPQP